MYEHMPPLSFTESNELDVESNVIPLLSRSALHRSASIRSKSLIYKKTSIRMYLYSEVRTCSGWIPWKDDRVASASSNVTVGSWSSA